MSILLRKGNSYTAEYTSTDFPTLSDDWTGSVSLYTTYPGTATLTKAMTRSGNKMVLSLTIEEILNLNSGVYSYVSTITNSALALIISSLEYATVTDATVFTTPMTRLYFQMSKTDATPAGRQTRTLVNTSGGTSIVLGWSGLMVTVSHAKAEVDDGIIVGVESISTTTNQAGYAEIYVIKGLTVSVSCPAFGKTITVDTTGHDDIDLSSYF